MCVVHLSSFILIHQSIILLLLYQQVFILLLHMLELFTYLLFLILHNVLFVSSFHSNLLSVSALTTSLNCIVTFLSNSCLIQDHSQETMIGTGNKCGNLYYLSLNSCNSSPSCNPCNSFAAINKNTTPLSIHELWHYRLGHIFPLIELRSW